MTPQQVQLVQVAVVLVLAFVLLISAVVWRNLRLRRRLRALLAAVPAPLLVAWYGSAPDPMRARSARLRTGREAKELGPDSLSTIEVLFQLSRLDRRPLLDYAPKGVPASFDALAAQVRDAGDAALERGAPAEELLAEQLRQQGHDVQLIPAGGEGHSGIGAQVDGLPVQLIGSVDAQDVRAFLERVPSVQVVTLAEHAQPFLDTARVVALNQVRARQVQPVSAVEDSPREPDGSIVAAGAEVVPSVKQPDETLEAIKSMGAVVAERSMSPLMLTALKSATMAASGDPNWTAHAKSGLVDQAGGAVGGWAGARAGAMAGALLGPLGSAAGTWLGGMLGKKVVDGFAGHQKSKKLRALLKRQDSFLAKVPRASSEALLAQALHLEATAALLRPTGFRRYWPSIGDAARGQIARQYAAWAKDSRTRGQALKSWLAKAKPSEAKRAARGRKLLEESTLAWSKDVVDLRAELLFLAPQIEAAGREAELATI